MVCVLLATNNLFAPEMAKNSPSETRTSRMAYCSRSLLPSSVNRTNRFQSIYDPSIGGCAATIRHINGDQPGMRCEGRGACLYLRVRQSAFAARKAKSRG